MMNSIILKSVLTKIKENEYRVPENIDAFELALRMLDNIGSTDPIFRDDLIYTTLFKWTKNGNFTSEQMRRLLVLSLDDNHLFYKLGETVTDSVFTRSFSVLIIPLAMYLNKQYNFLTKEEIIYIKNRLVIYFKNENDLRGYVKDKGWAHAIAHASDALSELVLSNYLNRDDLLDILNVIKNKVCINNYLYFNDEDERMAIAISNVINRNELSKNTIIEWIKCFKSIQQIGTQPEDDIIRSNSKHFLRSLYFKLLHQGDSLYDADEIIQTLSK